MLFCGNSVLICNINEASVALTNQKKEEICSQAICLFNNNNKVIEQQDLDLFCKASAVTPEELLIILKEKKEVLFANKLKAQPSKPLFSAIETVIASATMISGPYVAWFLPDYIINKRERALQVAQDSYMALKHTYVDKQSDIQAASKAYENVYGKCPEALLSYSTKRDIRLEYDKLGACLVASGAVIIAIFAPIAAYKLYTYYSFKNKTEQLAVIDAIIYQIENLQ